MITQKRAILALMVLSMCNTCILFAVAPSFRGLAGNDPAAAAPTQATAVSADGSAVVGAIGSEAFIWTENAGIRRLGDLPGGALSSIANAVSADGLVVVGTGTSTGVAYEPASPHLVNGHWSTWAEKSIDLGKAFRWTEAEGMVELYDGNEPIYLPHPLPPPFPSLTYSAKSAAYGVSADGSIVLGSVRGKAVRWDAAGGPETLTGQEPHPTMEYMGTARAMSADGRLIVGQLSRKSLLADDGFYESQAVYWSLDPTDDEWEIGGYGHLVYGAKWHNGTAIGLSSDGTVVVGYETWSLIESADGTETVSTEPTQACIWIWGGPNRSLGSLYEGAKSMAYAVSGDGSIVVGQSYHTIWSYVTPDFKAGVLGGGQETKANEIAFIWDGADGIRDLKNVLETKYGLDLRDWRLTSATGISADGRTIVGNGVHRLATTTLQGTAAEEERVEAWIVRLP
jgi:uncharacterized membrane protein